MKKLLFALFTSLTLCLTSCRVNEQTYELETTWLFWAILGLFVLVLIWGVKEGKRQEKAIKERGEKLKKASEEFNVSAIVVGVNNRYQFIVDDIDKNIIYMDFSCGKKIVPFYKIMSVEILNNKTTISSKSLGRTIGGALIGNLVAGRAGMIVGGLSGNSIKKKKVSKVEVVIKMSDFNNPTLHIPCFEARRETENAKQEIMTDDSIYGPMYKKGLEDAIRITELVDIIIDQMDMANPQPMIASITSALIADETPNYSTSIADEIKKLADMKAQGLITEEEFASLKSKLIN